MSQFFIPLFIPQNGSVKQIALGLLLGFNVLFMSVLKAEEAEAEAEASKAEVAEKVQLTKAQEKRKRLTELASIIREESALLSGLKKQARGLSKPDEELDAKIQQAERDLDIVQKSFEQIAVGSSSEDLIETQEEPKDWQEELTQVIKPLIENLRSLTEKPRKRDSLRQEVAAQEKIIDIAEPALDAIDMLVAAQETEKLVDAQLLVIRDQWQHQLTESQRKRELANIELLNLDGENLHWFEAAKISIKEFASERGLTLLIALAVAVIVVLLFRSITWFIEYRRSQNKRTVNRTTYRIIAYAQRILTILFVVIGVVVVFFLRGDVLLLAISAILIFASALGLRHFLPQFLDESRILLNIGSIREHELVIMNGVPWRVASINVYSKFINPEIKGVLRLPLDEMMGLVSRPIGEEIWFPSSEGDWVIADDDRVYQVVSQGPDVVELLSAQGTNKLIPSGDYFAAGFVNLTKSKGLRITGEFGLDYNLQSICLDVIPEKMQAGVLAYLENADLGTNNIRVRVEFKQAGASSLDYLVIVNTDPSVAPNYYRVQRYIQQACVAVCNEHGWGIPFPQLTVHKA